MRELKGGLLGGGCAIGVAATAVCMGGLCAGALLRERLKDRSKRGEGRGQVSGKTVGI